MSDYGHDLLFGTFVTPTSRHPQQAVALAQASERAGLDLATFQDHPYQPAFLDTWTLMSYAAARTERIHLSANVINLPLRPPAVLARSVASLDLLSGGRVELALGAGGFWDAIEAMSGSRLTAAESVEALEEAIEVIRALWDADTRGGVRVEGRHHRVVGAKRGPAPAHEVPIWVGALKPRMLRLVGRVADGWLPSLGYVGGARGIAEGNAIIDEAAEAAGRDPRAVRRLLNVGAGDASPAFLTELALEHGVSAFILASDDPAVIERYGQEVAPEVRELVEAERLGVQPPPTSGRSPAVAASPGRLLRHRGGVAHGGHAVRGGDHERRPRGGTDGASRRTAQCGYAVGRVHAAHRPRGEGDRVQRAGAAGEPAPRGRARRPAGGAREGAGHRRPGRRRCSGHRRCALGHQRYVVAAERLDARRLLPGVLQDRHPAPHARG